jgi:two-component system sensor histidine kinase/response regulator
LLSIVAETLDAERARLHFTIRDTGIGIGPEVQRRLFKPFSQADGSTSRKYGGTGLGLAISTQLVEAMGGRIGLESDPGKGSTFHFAISLIRQPPGAAAPARSRDLRGLRALIVDDNATNRQIVGHQLAAWEVESDAAAGGAQALAMLRDRRYDVAIIDFQMPEMDGLALARQIREDRRIQSVYLLMMSSWGDRAEAGADAKYLQGWLTKPVKQAQLREALSLVRPLAAAAPPSAQMRDRSTIGPPPSATTRPAAKPSQGAPGKVRVLVAEDNAINQRLAVYQLNKLGYEADAVANGLEAVQALERRAYPVVLMDCQMPELDGYEATIRIRRREAGERHVVIIAMTAHALEGDREKCLAVGMDDYLSKPVKTEDLQAMMDRWVPTVLALDGSLLDGRSSGVPPGPAAASGSR